MTKQDNQDLTSANPVAFDILAVSLPVFYRRSPGMFLVSFPILSMNLLENFDEIPLHRLNLGLMLKLNLGLSSGCNFIAHVIVSPA
ncbi:hypothetical protein BHE74_00007483 [Ensete ventricosum]|nr:hypothetical protein BHE74_00007483 [Ensete ventricosum]